jgi:hypothetical protein
LSPLREFFVSFTGEEDESDFLQEEITEALASRKARSHKKGVVLVFCNWYIRLVLGVNKFRADQVFKGQNTSGRKFYFGRKYVQKQEVLTKKRQVGQHEYDKQKKEVALNNEKSAKGDSCIAQPGKTKQAVLSW